MPRKLEIGPSRKHMKGYETIGMEYSQTKWDVTKPLPFEDGTFDTVLASHVIEHIEWTQTQRVLSQWARVVKAGGTLEIWTPDLNKVIDVIMRAENGETVSPVECDSHAKMMKRHNSNNDPFIWANYRVFAAENIKAAVQYHRCHRSMFTFRHLKNQMERAGLHDVRRCDKRPPYDHGWANMGVQGTK